MRRLLLVVVVLAGCSGTASVEARPKCVSKPGMVNTCVTQANIHQTICVRGWTATVRPPVSYTNALKRRQLGPGKDPANFEEDHIVPLEVGGNPTFEGNLTPQPWPEARVKDKVENRVNREVCAGTITLAVGQQCFITDWRACP
jgi:hypothetical protein